MTRLSVYSTALVGFVAATVMIIASISIPHWVSYSVTSDAGNTYDRHIGLHKACSNLFPEGCRPFPDRELCRQDRYFCSMWRSVGFIANFAAVIHLAGVAAFLVVMGSGKYQRERGWPFISVVLVLAAGLELTIMAMVAYLYDHDQQFQIPGWELDSSWILCLSSATISLLGAVGLTLSAYLLPPEDGYDFLIEPMSP